jgi:hypothetical protein
MVVLDMATKHVRQKLRRLGASNRTQNVAPALGSLD